MRFFLIIVIIFFAFAMPAQAQVSAPFDTARMQRDLDIMNAILDRLVFNVPGHFARLGGETTQGIYLPDYGVIFLMPQRSSAFGVYHFLPGNSRRRVEVYQRGEAYKKSKPASTGGGGTAYEYHSADPQKIKAPLIEFFSKYADAIGQLDGSEKIAIYTTGGENIFYSFGEGWQVSAGSGAEAGNRDMLAIASKADVIALRSGKLKSNDFTNRLVFKNIETASANSEIDIMARIIDTALAGTSASSVESRSREPRFHGNNARGIYLDDFGVVFFTDAAFGHDISIRILQDIEKRTAENISKRIAEESLEHRLLEMQKAMEEKHEDWRTGYRKFKQQLGDVIADYGHTLRRLKPQDHIVITANLDNAPDDGPNYLVCRIKKQNVDAFNARRISREQLMKLISYMEY